MGVDLYRTHSLGSSFYGFEDSFYMSPGNDRQIIALFTSPDPELRQVLHLQDMLLDTVDPRLKSVRYTRAPDSELPSKRKRINLFFREKPVTQDA